MEEAMARPRYTRRAVPGSKHRRTARENGRLPRIIARQLLIALILLLVVGIAKNINSPVTNFMSEKVRFVLGQDIELKSIYDYMSKAVVSIRSSIATDSKEDVQKQPVDTSTENDSLPVVEPEGNKASDANEGISSSEPESSVLSASYVADTVVPTGMLIPVSGVLSSHFGERTDPKTGGLKFHEGIDIEASEGSPIKAVLDGVVEEAGSSPSYGNFIRLAHSGGLQTVYAHCSVLNTKKGVQVKQGDIVANTGKSGAAVGVHLHFEVLKDGIPVNPLDYINLDSL